MDYAFRTATTGLNLNSVQGKTAAVDALLPIVAGMNDDVRRDHYLNKLADMTGTSYRSMESALSKLKTARTYRTTTKTSTVDKSTRSLLASPVEEYMLVLLLQHPELKEAASSLPAAYFENSENREIFRAWLEHNDTDRLREILDNTVREHFELLLGRKLPDAQPDRKYADCSSLLQMKYLRNLEKKKAQVLVTERETGGTDAELAKLEEQGITISEDLKTVFTQRGQSRKR
jgi:DNA primase